jgi:hypothetical protein
MTVYGEIWLAVDSGPLRCRSGSPSARLGQLLLVLGRGAILSDHVSAAGTQLGQRHRHDLIDVVRNLPVSVPTMLGARATSRLLGFVRRCALGKRSRLPLPGTVRGGQRLLQHGNALTQSRVLGKSGLQGRAQIEVRVHEGGVAGTVPGGDERTGVRYATALPDPTATPLSNYVVPNHPLLANVVPTIAEPATAVAPLNSV